MTRYEALKTLVQKWREEGNAASPLRCGVYKRCARELEAALALPEDSKVVNAELYGMAVELADEFVREEIESTNAVTRFMDGTSELDIKAHAKELRYLSLREASGEPMPYRVVRDGDKVRFQ